MGKPPNQNERTSMKLAWAKANGLKEYTGSAYFGLRFLNHKMPESYVRFPGEDHVTYWNKDGKPYCIVSQPYHFDDDEMNAAVTLAHHWNLEIRISAGPAWHYPDGVLFMQWKSKRP